MPPSRSANFRKLAADNLRAGRKAALAGDRATRFEVAASYKSLAHDEEWMRGERQRSFKRKKKSKAPKA